MKKQITLFAACVVFFAALVVLFVPEQVFQGKMVGAPARSSSSASTQENK